MRIIADHFRRYAHALRFAIGLHGAEKFHPIVKNKHYHISSGARASLLVYMVHRNSTELLKINTTKFQVEREPVYLEVGPKHYGHPLYQGRQTRQNSGGVADLTKGGLQKILHFYAIKI